MRRKILILASWYPSGASPVSGIFVRDQALALSRRYDVAVVAPQLFGFSLILQKATADCEGLQNEAGLPVFRKRVQSFVPREAYRAYPRWLRAARIGFLKIREAWGKPDLIHAHVVLPGGLAAVRLGNEFSIPVVLTEHSSPLAMQLSSHRQRQWVKETLSQVKRIIAVSPTLAGEIRDFHRDAEIDVVGNLIKTEFFVPSGSPSKDSSGKRTRFLSVALLNRQKGLSYLLDAAHLLIQKGHDAFEIIIGGDGPERRRLEQQSRALGLNRHCQFLGLLTPAQVQERMQQGDVFVLPSLHESFGIVLGEAMSCGMPAISTRCGGPEFVITPETGVLVQPGDVPALANVMLDFMSDNWKYDSLIIRRSVVERFGEESFLKATSAIYEQIWS